MWETSQNGFDRARLLALCLGYVKFGGCEPFVLLTLKYVQLQAHAQYGELTTLSMGTKTWVLLNSARVVKEIIAKRAAITHERPDFPVSGELVSRNNRFFLYKTKQWKKGRRLLHRLLLGPSAKDHDDIVDKASIALLQAYEAEPELWYKHNYRYPVSVIYKIITGTDFNLPEHLLFDLQNVTSTFLTSINSSFVEFFPTLRYLPKPLQFWRPYWEKIGAFHYDVFKNWWSEIRAPHDDISSSFVRDIILDEYSSSEDQAMYLTMLAIAAGADNPRMTMNAFLMACLAYPGSMRRAREELDLNCYQTSRLPVLEDLKNLPYVCAVVKEVLRWRPTVPLIPQRVLVEELKFEGYTFPAGTEFLVNSVAVCSDESLYAEPHKFMPERWLQAPNGLEQDLWQFAFSAGRRSCVGYKLAQKLLFLSFARLIYCFDFVPCGHFNDKELNAFRMGEPFPVKAVIRSHKHKELIA